MSRLITIRDCWARGFSISEASERTVMTEETVRNYYKKYEREMREFFLEEKEKDQVTSIQQKIMDREKL